MNMKKIRFNQYAVLASLLFAFVTTSHAQVNESDGAVLRQKEAIADEKPSTDKDKAFDVVEVMPEFPGGQAALLKWISGNIKYPAIAEENGIQGRVVCTFIVERDGSVNDVQVARSIDPSLDGEAVRVLKLMPKWNPGKQNGQTVRVKYTVPVTFKLGDKPKPVNAAGSVMLPFILKSAELQDLTTMDFIKMVRGKRGEMLSFNLQYMKDRNKILTHCIPFFFDDQTNDSFDDALNQYVKSIGKEKKVLKEIDVEKKFKLSVLNNIQGKYISFLAELGMNVKTGKITNRTGRTMAFLYDVANDRILSLNDILKPQYAETVMNSDFSNHLTLSPSALVWGQKAGNTIRLNQIDFLTNADHFTDEFRQAVNLDAEIASYQGEVLKAKEVIADEMPKDGGTKVFDVVEQMPEFAPCSYGVYVRDHLGKITGTKTINCPGGQAGLLKFIADNLKYPTIAEENGIQGRVVCTFVIDPDGSVTDVQVARSIDPSLDKEAVRVLSKMPKWKPGMHKGQPVRVKYTVPVTFKLQ